MRFVLVETHDEREFPPYKPFRATCGEHGIDHFFWAEDVSDAKTVVRSNFPDATFYGDEC